MNSQDSSAVEDTLIDNNDTFPIMNWNWESIVNTSKDVSDRTTMTKQKKTFPCTECGVEFPYKSGYLSHKTKHSKVKPFICPECSRGFDFKRDLNRHVLNQHINKPLSCNECSLKFRSKERLEKHMHTHFGYTCPECGHHSRDKSSYHDHFMNIHRPDERQYACTICNFKSTYPFKLKYHMKRHMGVKPFICDICGNRFSALISMQKHKLIHENKKPYECITCKKTFRSNSSLTVHLHTHTGEKLFFCDKCNFGAVTRGEVRKHIDTVHSNKRPFECSACGNKYKTKGNLTKHQNGTRGICHATELPILDDRS